MKAASFALVGLLCLLAGCSAFENSSPQLQAQSVISCSYNGQAYKSSSTIIADASASCQVTRDGYPSATAYTSLQKRGNDGIFRTVVNGPKQNKYLGAGSGTGTIRFDHLKASGLCSTFGNGTYRAAMFISWPADVPNPVGRTDYGSPNTAISC